MSSAAIIVGVDDYEEEPLTSAVNDALAFRDATVSLGMVAAADVQLLTAPERPDSRLASNENIKNALYDFYTGAANVDRLFFYFSGHGMSLHADPARSVHRTSIVPCDVHKLDRDGDRLIDVDDMLERFRMVGPREQFFVIDACRNLPYESYPTPGKMGWTPQAAEWDRSQAVLYAVSPLGQALGEKGGLGAFTSHLVDALNARGRALEYSAEDDEYVVTMHSVRSYVYDKLEPLITAKPMWARRYMLPRLHAPDPPVSPLRKVDSVEPVLLTVHIDPDAAAAGTNVLVLKGRTPIPDKSWPPTSNHTSVPLEPQWHILEVASQFGIPNQERLKIDPREQSDVTIEIASAVGGATVGTAGSPEAVNGFDSLIESRSASTAGAIDEHAVWELTFGQVRSDAAPTADLLTLVAFLAPEDIPLLLLAAHADVLPGPLGPALAGMAEGGGVGADKLLEPIRKLWIVRPGGDAITVHRSVQAMVLERLDQAGQRRWAESAINVLVATFPQTGEDVRVWSACTRLLPHALVAAGHAESLQIAPEATATLLSAAALFLNARAQYSEAKAAVDRALGLDLKALGPDHPSVARDRNYRGRILRNLGDLEAARKEYQQALDINQAAHGEDHPSVATDLVGLGRVLLESGDAHAAKAIHERALRIDEAADPPNRSHIARDLVMLGRVLHKLGDLDQAVELYMRGIAADEVEHGRDHPEIATDLVDLGRVLMDQDDHAGAIARFDQALAIDEAKYGPQHPAVARDLANLGRVLGIVGETERARSMLEQALAIDEKAYPAQHPFIARDRAYLADLAHLPPPQP